VQATFDGLTTRSGRYGSLREYKNLAHVRAPNEQGCVMTCPRQGVKAGDSARNCLHCASGSMAVIRGQSAICPRSQVDWRLA